MSRFVFSEPPRAVLNAAAPLYAELAAIQVQLALLKLARKYRPDQPRVPVGNPNGGRWTDTGGIRVAGGAEDEETSRRSTIEDPMTELRQESFNNSVRTLRRLEPDNPYLTYVSDGSAPGQDIVDAYSSEVEAAQARATNKIANGHAFSSHAGEFGVSDRSDFAQVIREIIGNPATQVRDFDGGRTGFYDSSKNTIVFIDPLSRDGGTMFKPTLGQKYFDIQKGR